MPKKNKVIIIQDVKISPKQHKVISGCIQHKQRKGLGDYIGMAQNTVNSHLKLLFARLDVHSLSELIVLAIKSGYDCSGKWLKIVWFVLQLSNIDFPLDC